MTTETARRTKSVATRATIAGLVVLVLALSTVWGSEASASSQTNPAHVTSASATPRSIVITRGAKYGPNGNCSSASCAYVAVRVSHFAPGARLSLAICDNGSCSKRYPFKVGPNGSLVLKKFFYFGYPGHTARVRDFKTGVSSNRLVWSAPLPPSIYITRGGKYGPNANCSNASCAFVNVQVSHFSPGAALSLVICDNGACSGAFHFTADGSGNYTVNNFFYFGFPGHTATIRETNSSVTSNGIVW